MHQKSLVELAAGLRSGAFSSEELTRACLDRIHAHDAPVFRSQGFLTGP